MMGQQCRSESLFYYFRIEDHVPEHHLLHLIDRYVNFDFVRERLKTFYSGRGRDISCLIRPAQNPHERSLAHAALISDDWRRSVARDKGGARVEKEATAWQSRSCVPTSPHAFDCDGTERATTC
jgi:hypothetical protein